MGFDLWETVDFSALIIGITSLVGSLVLVYKSKNESKTSAETVVENYFNDIVNELNERNKHLTYTIDLLDKKYYEIAEKYETLFNKYENCLNKLFKVNLLFI